MTVEQFYVANRDPRGRAFVRPDAWLEHGPGCFLLYGPGGQLQVLADENAGHLPALAESLIAPPPSEDADDPYDAEPMPVDEPEEPEAEMEEVSVADADDLDYAWVTADEPGQLCPPERQTLWPGLNNDDAEAGGFEDAVGDSEEEGDDLDEW